MVLLKETVNKEMKRGTEVRAEAWLESLLKLAPSLTILRAHLETGRRMGWLS